MDSIKGKVLAIIDEFTVVLNIGSENNVTEDMMFAICTIRDEITDPATGKYLGKYENMKAKINVKNVAEKYSTTQISETAHRTVGL
jgi:hypothetical protein